MIRRHVKSRRSDRKRFSKTASGIHKKNLRAMPMRGGFRL